jgi:arylsulfatase A-like enzyme
MPTLLGLAGVPAPRALPGRDLRATLEGRADPRLPPPVLFSEERFAVVDKLSVRAGNLKLIFNNDGPALWRAGAHLELYDLSRDPAGEGEPGRDAPHRGGVPGAAARRVPERAAVQWRGRERRPVRPGEGAAPALGYAQ